MNKGSFMIKGKAKSILFYWLPVFLWCVLIFSLSSIPSLRSSLPDNWDLFFRKLAHMTEFAVLTFLFFRASAMHISQKRSLIYAVLFAFVFALTDEYHQTFVYGRSGNLFDAMIDGLGIFFAFFMISKRGFSPRRIK